MVLRAPAGASTESEVEGWMSGRRIALVIRGARGGSERSCSRFGVGVPVRTRGARERREVADGPAAAAGAIDVAWVPARARGRAASARGGPGGCGLVGAEGDGSCDALGSAGRSWSGELMPAEHRRRLRVAASVEGEGAGAASAIASRRTQFEGDVAAWSCARARLTMSADGARRQRGVPGPATVRLPVRRGMGPPLRRVMGPGRRSERPR